MFQLIHVVDSFHQGIFLKNCCLNQFPLGLLYFDKIIV